MSRKEGYQEFRFVYSNSSYDFQIFPQNVFQESLIVSKNISRSVDGSVHSFKIKDSVNYNYTFQLSFVNSSDSFRINDLWQSQEEFDFRISNEQFNFDYKGRIINETQPMDSRPDQQFDLRQGTVQFRTSTNTVTIQPSSLGPFILNDTNFGVIDGFLGVL